MRVAREVFGVGVGVLLVLGAVLVAVDAVEQASHLRGIGAAAWAWGVLAGLPLRLVAAAPVAGAVAAGLVAWRWQREGWLLGLSAVGIPPVRTAAMAAVGALGVAVLAGGLREAAAPWTAGEVAADGRWVAVPQGETTCHLRARRLDGGRAVGLDAVWVRSGRVVERLEAASGRWTGETWSLDQVQRASWEGSGALPDPSTWRRHAVEPGPATPAPRLWRAPPSPARGAWLVERVATPLGTALLAFLAVPWALRRPAAAVPGLLVLSVGWRLIQGGLLAAAARGSWSVGLAGGAPLVVLAVLAAGAAVASRRVG